MKNVINMIPLTKAQARELGRVLLGLSSDGNILDFDIAADDSGVRVSARTPAGAWEFYIPGDRPMGLHSPCGCGWEYSERWHTVHSEFGAACAVPEFLR